MQRELRLQDSQEKEEVQRVQTYGRQHLEVGINVCYLLSDLHRLLLGRDRWFLQTGLKVSLAFPCLGEKLKSF